MKQLLNWPLPPLTKTAISTLLVVGCNSTNLQTNSTTQDGGTACVVRSQTYETGVQFVWKETSTIGYPDCTPTCGVDPTSIQALPAGECGVHDSACAMLAFWACPTYCPGIDAGSMGANSFLCMCNDGVWSCTIAS